MMRKKNDLVRDESSELSKTDLVIDSSRSRVVFFFATPFTFYVNHILFNGLTNQKVERSCIHMGVKKKGVLRK